MRGVRHWSRRFVLFIGLSCVVFGTLMLTVVAFTKPWVKKPRIAAKPIRRQIQFTEKAEGLSIQGVLENEEMEEDVLESGILGEEKDPSSKSQEASMMIPEKAPEKGIDEKVVVVRAPKLPKTGKITQILVDKRKQVIHVTLMASRKIGEYNCFKLKKPPSLVIDIWNVEKQYPKNNILVDHPLLKRVRTEKHPKKTRFVFESASPQVPMFRVRRADNRLIVSFGQVYPP